MSFLTALVLNKDADECKLCSKVTNCSTVPSSLILFLFIYLFILIIKPVWMATLKVGMLLFVVVVFVFVCLFVCVLGEWSEMYGVDWA